MSGMGRGSICSLVTATSAAQGNLPSKTWINARPVSGGAADVTNTRRAKLNVQVNSLCRSLKDLLLLAFLPGVSCQLLSKTPNKTCRKMFRFYF